MLPRLLRLYWRETCNLRTLAFLLVMLLLTGIVLFSLNGIGSSPASSGSSAASSFFQPVRLSVVDADHSLISNAIIDNLADLDVVDHVYVESLPEAKTRLTANETLLILVIPSGFYDQTTQGLARDSLQVYLNDRMPAESAILVRLMNNSADSMSAVQASLYAWAIAARPLFSDDQAFYSIVNATTLTLALRMLGRQNLVDINLAAKFNTAWFVVSALTCLFTMLPVLLILMLVQQERAIGQHERLLLANVPWWQLHLAKTLIGLMWLLAGLLPEAILLLRLYPQLDPLLLLAAILLLYLVTATLGLALAYRSRQDQAILLAAWLGIIGLLLLGGCIYPVQLLAAWIQPFVGLSPAYWSFRLIYGGLGSQSLSAGLLLAPLGMLAIGSCLSYVSWRWAR